MTTLTLDLSYRNPGTDALESNPLSPPITSDWQFAKAQQYGAKMPLYPIYPRPTAEVNSFACHLWAHSTMPYELKPCAMFGCWPHKWELITAPAGMTIGGELTRTAVDGLVHHTVGASYQKISWPGAKSGTHSVHARCTDNMGNSVDFYWDITVSDARYAFVDIAAANDSGDGSISSPKKLFNSAWASSNTGKTVVMRSGSYVISEDGATDQVKFNLLNRPTAIITYPGEAVSITGASFGDADGESANDLVIRGIKLVDYEGGGNTYVFGMFARQKRVTFSDVTFDDIRGGSVGDNNQSCICFPDAGFTHDHITIIDCTLLSGCDISLFIIFRCNYVLLERPSALDVAMPDSNGAGFYNIKDQSDNICVRGDFWRGTMALGAVPCLISNQNAPGNNIEHCWYTTIHPGGVAVYWNLQRFLAGGSNQFDYAGSARTPGSDCLLFAKYGASDLLVVNEGIAGYGDNLYGGPSDGVTGGAVGNQLLTADQINATTGKLEGTGTAYRLTRGAECWSEPV